MSPLRVERYLPDRDDWALAGVINWGDRDGSISANNPDGGRDIYLFGVDMINRQGFIKKSIGGIDETNPSVRKIDSLGFTAIASLANGESYELETVTDTSRGETRRVRFTYSED